MVFSHSWLRFYQPWKCRWWAGWNYIMQKVRCPPLARSICAYELTFYLVAEPYDRHRPWFGSRIRTPPPPQRKVLRHEFVSSSALWTNQLHEAVITYKLIAARLLENCPCILRNREVFCLHQTWRFGRQGGTKLNRKNQIFHETLCKTY
jgi:hypothetical protein